MRVTMLHHLLLPVLLLCAAGAGAQRAEREAPPPRVEPVHLSHFQQFDTAQSLVHRFAIAPGATLVIQQISIACSPRTPMGAMVIGRSTDPGRDYATVWLNFDVTGLQRFRDHAYATQAVTYYVHGGDELEFRILADDPDNGVCTLGAIGVRRAQSTP